MMSAGRKTAKVKLNLCCSYTIKPGYINVDIRDLPGVDQVVDLNKPWPWAESSVDEVHGQDAVEHLAPLGREMGQENIVEVMRRIWTVLKPNGLAHIVVPSTDGRGAWQDPTHITYWNINTFKYFLPGFGHQRIYKFDPLFKFEGSGLYVKNTPPTQDGVVWVDVKIRAIKK